MSSASFILDPRSQNSGNAPLELFRDANRGGGVYVVESSFPDPEQEDVSSQGREGRIARGKPRVDNRKIPLSLFVTEGDEPAATNLVTNPALELGTTGYAAQAGGSISLVDGGAYGEKSLSVVAAASGDGVSGEIVTVAGSRTVYGVIWASVPLGQTLRVSLVELSAASAVLGTTDADLPGAGEWRAYRVSRAFGATGVKARLRATGLAAFTFRADAFLISDGVDAVHYFDGDSPGSRWAGTAHASASTRPAPGGARMDRIVGDLEEKLEKIRGEKGTLSRPYKAGRGFFDLETARGGDGALNGRQYRQGGQAVALELEARPYMRGATVAGATTSETAKPVLEIVQDAPEGSAWAAGELEITDASNIERLGFVGGFEVADFTQGAADTDTYLQAEALTPLNGGSIVTQSGAQGGGSNNALEAALSTGWQGLLSTTKLSGAADLKHVGTYAIWARVFAPSANAGDVSLRFAWAQGDLSEERLEDPLVVPFRNGFYLARLGIIRTTKAITGAQRWRGRILGKTSIAGDKIRLDDLRIIPASEAYVEASASTKSKAPDAIPYSDGFNQAGNGSLGGKTADNGGAWTTSGGATDYGYDSTNKRISRSVLTDASIQAGRAAVLGAAMGDLVTATDFTFTNYGGSLVCFGGLLARYTDANNFLAFGISYSDQTLQLRGRLAGDDFNLLNYTGSFLPANVPWRLKLAITSRGEWSAWLGFGGYTTPDPQWSGVDDRLGSGTLSSGKVGLLDAAAGASASTRIFDNFAAYAPVYNPVCRAGKKLYWRATELKRQDATGTGETRVVGEGDNLLIPPKRREGRKLRFAGFLTRGNLDGSPDADPGDDLSGKLTTTSRYLTVRGN